MEKDKDIELIRQGLEKAAKGGLLLIICVILSKLFVFLRQVAITRLLSPADYGLFSLGFNLTILYTLIGSLGFNFGSQRFIAYYYEKNELAAVRGTIIYTSLVMTASSIVLMAASIALSWPLSSFFNEPEMKTVLILLAPIAPLTIGISTISSFYLGFNRVGMKSYIEYFGLTFTSFLSVLLFILFFHTLTSALFGLLLSYILVFLLSFLYSSFRFPVSLLKERFERSVFKELLFFSVPLLAVSSLNFLVVHTDTLMLGYYSVAEQVGFYNAAYSISVFVGLFLVTFSHIYLSIASGFIALNVRDEVSTLYSTATKWIFIFTCPLFVIFFFFPADILGLTYGTSYKAGATALQLLCLGEFIFILTGPNIVTLTAYGKTKSLMAYFLIGTITNILLNMLLIPRYGMSGAATASAIALAIVNILCSLHLYVSYGIYPFRKGFNLMLLLLSTAAGMLYFPFTCLARISALLLLGLYPFLLMVSLFIVGWKHDPADRIIFSVFRHRFTGIISASRNRD